jgi:hypothetical protein
MLEHVDKLGISQHFCFLLKEINMTKSSNEPKHVSRNQVSTVQIQYESINQTQDALFT